MPRYSTSRRKPESKRTAALEKRRARINEYIDKWSTGAGCTDLELMSAQEVQRRAQELRRPGQLPPVRCSHWTCHNQERFIVRTGARARTVPWPIIEVP